MKPSPTPDPDSPFANFQRFVQKLVQVPKAELDAEVAKHEAKVKSYRKANPTKKRGRLPVEHSE